MESRLELTVVLMLAFSVTSLALEPGELLDMSYEFGDDTLYWPGSDVFKTTMLLQGPYGQIPWVEMNSFSGPEHGGTHLDAPSHFSEGKLYVHEIPVSRFVGPAVRVDISEEAAMNRDYLMSVEDLVGWEDVHGKIPDGALLFVFTGWGAFWPDRLAFFGSSRNDTYLDDQGNSFLHFPGVAPEAASWLVANRQISGLGIDTPSLDNGPSTDSMSHRILYGANIYGIENVANLDKLPNTGARVHALPMKIKDGSGAPMRIVAMLDADGTSSAAILLPGVMVMILAASGFILM